MDEFYADPIDRDPLWMIVLSWFAKILSPRL